MGPKAPCPQDKGTKGAGPLALSFSRVAEKPWDMAVRRWQRGFLPSTNVPPAIQQNAPCTWLSSTRPALQQGEILSSLLDSGSGVWANVYSAVLPAVLNSLAATKRRKITGFVSQPNEQIPPGL